MIVQCLADLFVISFYNFLESLDGIFECLPILPQNDTAKIIDLKCVTILDPFSLIPQPLVVDPLSCLLLAFPDNHFHGTNLCRRRAKSAEELRLEICIAYGLEFVRQRNLLSSQAQNS